MEYTCDLHKFFIHCMSLINVLNMYAVCRICIAPIVCGVVFVYSSVCVSRTQGWVNPNLTRA